MATSTSASKEAAVPDIRNEWLGCQEALRAKHSFLQRVEEPPNPLALVVNLGSLPIKTTMDSLVGKDESVIKDHPGLRVTFMVLRILYPGWSSVQQDTDGASGIKRKIPGAPAPKQAPRERYAKMVGESVQIHSYELVNKKGQYSKGGRSEEYVTISPGMLLTNKIFGNKLLNVFKPEQCTEDIAPFTLALVQLGTKSIQSKGVENGMLLEVKTFAPLKSYSLGVPRFIPTDLLAPTMQQAEIKRGQFIEPPAPEDGSEDSKLNVMSMIRGNLSNSTYLLDAGIIDESRGVFALTPEGKIKMHLSAPIGDVIAGSVNIAFDPRDHGTTDPEWLAKLYNVAAIAGALRLFLLIDTYRSKNTQPCDQVLDGFVSVDPALFVASMHLASAVTALTAGHDPELLAQYQESGDERFAKHFTLFSACGSNTKLDIAVDNRRMMQRTPPVISDDDNEAKPEPITEIFSALAHPKALWNKGRMVQVFYEKRPVIGFVARWGLDLPAVTGGTARAGLNAMPLASLAADSVSYEDAEPEESATRKKSKK